MIKFKGCTILVSIILLLSGGLLGGLLMQHFTTKLMGYEGFAVVSIMQLIVDPQRWTGRKVSVMGYLSGDTTPRLFASEWSAEVFDYASAFNIDNPAGEVSLGEVCGQRYVELLGSFEIFEGSYMLSDVVEILDPGKLEYCYIREEK